jgi:hypothetical protein
MYRLQLALPCTTFGTDARLKKNYPNNKDLAQNPSTIWNRCRDGRWRRGQRGSWYRTGSRGLVWCGGWRRAYLHTRYRSVLSNRSGSQSRAAIKRYPAHRHA